LALPRNVAAVPVFPRNFGKWDHTYDAIKFLKVVRFARNLKSTHLVDEALHDAIDLKMESGFDADFAQCVVDVKTKLPNVSSIAHGRQKLDAVGMLLQRREMQDLALVRSTEVRSAHVFTDGSPIQGSELQGMVFQFILMSGAVTTLVMPGVKLAYGCTSLAAKVFSFLWSLFLLVGPNMTVMAFWLGCVKSLTTDMGTEIGMGVVADVLPAFLAHIAGADMESLLPLVRAGSRLFRKAIRLPGWGHTFGNLMSHAVKSITRWPNILFHLRALCRFFRVGMWRDAIVKAICGRLSGAKKLLSKFKGNLVKWRYETLWMVFNALIPLRHICQGFLAAELPTIFESFQDGELLQTVLAACRWNDLWVFLPFFFQQVLNPLEHARRWGLVCECHKELRALEPNKRIECDRNSRRLGQVRVFLSRVIDQMASSGRAVQGSVEGISWIAIETACSERSTSMEMSRKTSWKDRVPWRFVEVCDPEQAKIILAQLKDIDDAVAEPLILDYKARFLDDIEALG
jgi:hypothetical protein